MEFENIEDIMVDEYNDKIQIYFYNSINTVKIILDKELIDNLIEQLEVHK